MKKSLIALAALAATASFAQSTATISGSINVGILDTGKSGDVAAVSSLGGGANAINIATVEDLGGGLRGGFSGQIRFNAATGDRNSSGTGNALFHEANAYIAGGFGTARIGKIAEASNCAFDAWGCTGGAAFGGGTGVSTLAGALAVANAVSYTTPTMNGFSASVMSSVSAASRVNERRSFTLNYAQGPLAVQYLQTDNTANTAADALTPTAAVLSGSNTNIFTALPITAVSNNGGIKDEKAKQTSIAASYNFGVAKLNVLNVREENSSGANTKNVEAINASVPMGAYTFLAGYAKDKKEAAANKDTKIALGVNYALSKRSTLGADVFKAEQGDNTGTGFVVRMRHTF